MIVLGLTFDTHDASASIFVDGELLAAAEEERFNREKHTKSFPENSISFCLEKAGCSVNDIDYVALFMDPNLCLRILPRTMSCEFPRSLSYLPYGLKWYKRRQRMYNDLCQRLKDCGHLEIRCVPHHIAHAQSAFWASGYQKALVITLDGRGEFETIGIFLGENGVVRKVKSICYPHSIGYFYSTGTKYLGFKPKYDEYKVMGLAGYGRYDEAIDHGFKQLYQCENGSFSLNLSYFDHHTGLGKRSLYSKKYLELFGPARKTSHLTEEDANWAFALQRHTEQIICDLATHYHLEYPDYNNLCLAGGVALNCAANSKLAGKRLFNRIFVQPASNDAGTSLGAAAYIAYQVGDSVSKNYLMTPYTGPSFLEQEILDCISKKSIKWTFFEDICAEAAARLHKGQVLGWFQGAMEFGPRALGNRSILAAPQKEATKDKINECIKHREPFRPFAPAVLKEFADEYFLIEQSAEDLYPYMLATAAVREEKVHDIAATVHVDSTSRIQLVTKENNPLFYRLIQEYHSLSGIPVLLNTSFNIKGEPIVCSPMDAVNSFINSSLDACFIGHYCLEKESL